MVNLFEMIGHKGILYFYRYFIANEQNKEETMSASTPILNSKLNSNKIHQSISLLYTNTGTSLHNLHTHSLPAISHQTILRPAVILSSLIQYLQHLTSNLLPNKQRPPATTVWVMLPVLGVLVVRVPGAVLPVGVMVTRGGAGVVAVLMDLIQTPDGVGHKEECY